MNFVNEYALLFAVALPVIVIVGAQACLYLAGERGTLLIPGFDRYPSIALSKQPQAVEARPVVPAAARAVECSNDEMERLAA